MSFFTYDQNVFATIKANDDRRNRRAFISAIIILIVLVLIAVGIYYVVKLRASQDQNITVI